MGIENLPSLGKAPWKWPLRVVERAEIIRGNEKVMAYVAGLSSDRENMIFDTKSLVVVGGIDFIEYGNHKMAKISECIYIPIEPIIKSI